MIRLMIRLISQIRKLKHRGFAVEAQLVSEMPLKQRAEYADSLPFYTTQLSALWGNFTVK